MKEEPHPIPTAFIVLNPVAGLTNAQVLQRHIESRFRSQGWNSIFHFTGADEAIAPLVREQIEKGVDLVVAVGGDGTIAAVAAGMVNSPVPLGIIPTGTWNAIARNLSVPFSIPRAVRLMTGNHNIKKLDLMAVGNSYQAMNISIGFSSSMIANTGRDIKRRWGILAYLVNLFKQVFGLQQRRYTIDADGVRFRGRATEIFVANYGVVGFNALEAALEIKPDDGKVDLLIVRARTILDLPAMVWQVLIRRQKRSPKYRQISVEKNLVIRTSPPGIVQADGELIGETPITVSVMPRCVKVIVPHPLTVNLPRPANLPLPTLRQKKKEMPHPANHTHKAHK